MNLLRIHKIAFVSLIVLLLLVSGGMGSLFMRNRSTNTPSQKDLNVYEASILDGQNYLLHTFDEIEPFQRLVMDYLQRQYNLNPRFNGMNTRIEPPVDEVELLEFNIHKRIAYPKQLADSLPSMEKIGPLGEMMMTTTYCDRIPLPQDFEQLVRQNIEIGGYNLTHVAYSLERVKENNCPITPSVDQQLRIQIATEMERLVTDSNTNPDLRYETIALLMHMGRRDLVKNKWIKEIISEQLSDGGWKKYSGGLESDDHATVMALWALLEFVRHDIPEEPVIRLHNS